MLENAPLNSCMLIDSRLSSRAELLSYLSKTGLFERFIEPETLEDGYLIASRDSPDVCIFGPSVSTDNIKIFIADLEEAETQSGCAYISAHREGNRDEISGLHSQVNFPCSNREFNTAIIQALTKVNNGSLPESKRKHPVTGESLSLRDAIEKLELEDDILGSNTYKNIESLNKNEQREPIFTTQAAALVNVLAELEPQGLKFRPDGSPTAFTKDIIKSVINKLFSNAAFSLELDEFKIELEKYLYKWVLDACVEGRKQANQNLRRAILCYFRMDMS